MQEQERLRLIALYEGDKGVWMNEAQINDLSQNRIGFRGEMLLMFIIALIYSRLLCSWLCCFLLLLLPCLLSFALHLHDKHTHHPLNEYSRIHVDITNWHHDLSVPTPPELPNQPQQKPFVRSLLPKLVPTNIEVWVDIIGH